jgi:hypothetical protein
VHVEEAEETGISSLRGGGTLTFIVTEGASGVSKDKAERQRADMAVSRRDSSAARFSFKAYRGVVSPSAGMTAIADLSSRQEGSTMPTMVEKLARG